MKFLSSLMLICLFATSTFSWSNGGETKKKTNVKFGTHDWIAYEGFRLAQPDADLNWIKSNLDAFFLGTEAPDTSAFLSSFTSLDGYSDAIQCHCILYNDDLDVIRDRAAMRAQQEFDRAKNALETNDKHVAAFHAGAMAHYIGDLSQFMHIMGTGSRWGKEAKAPHSRYEEVIDKTIVSSTRKSTLLSAFIKKTNVSGTTAEKVTLNVAEFVDTGGGSVRTTGWMYKRWLAIMEGDERDTSTWTNAFLDQTGKNVNFSANGVRELLIKLSQ